MNEWAGRVHLTGFIGERTNRPVALVTDDFRLYHELAPFFEAQGVQLLGLRPGEPVPDAVRVLLNGPADDPRSVAVRADNEATWLAVAAKWDARAGPRRVVIGADPGETIGLAVLVDGMVYWTAEARGVDAALARLLAWRTGLAPDSWALHVGDGAAEIGFALSRGARKSWPELRVSIVPEAGSTPPSAVTGSRHTDAAIRIALREP